MILVFGKTGQVAVQLQRTLPDALYLGRNEADLSEPESCRAAIMSHEPTAVINAAAWTDVDAAENAVDEVTKVNAYAPRAMAQACKQLSIPFIHISTDYVFNGSGDQPLDEEVVADPQNVYGQSKRMGEILIEQSGTRFAILRTSWVFSAHGSNFVRSILRLAKERDSLNIVGDQHGGPTPAWDIARAVVDMANALIQGANSGIYHFSGTPDTTWADFASQIVARAGLFCEISKITSAEYPTVAFRPKNSRLDCAKIAADFDIARPDWRTGLDDILREWGEIT